MRLFVALDIDEAIRERLNGFVAGLRKVAPEIRFVGPETYHITLKFLGETSRTEDVRRVLEGVRGASFEVALRGTGFFPGLKNPRVFWAGIHSGPELAALASAVDAALALIGFGREGGPFKPHLTLARSGSGRPHPLPHDKSNTKLARLQERLSQLPQPEFGTMTAREFILYESRLSSRGAQYFKIARYPLG